MVFWVTGAVLIIVVLAAIAARLQWLLRQKNKAEQEKRQEQHSALLERRAYAHKSIKILANAVLEDQVTLTEASIRISGLARTFPLNQQERDFHTCFFELADKTAHIPYLDKWKELDNKQQKIFTKERITLEARAFDSVRDACKHIGEDKTYLEPYLNATL